MRDRPKEVETTLICTVMEQNLAEKIGSKEPEWDGKCGQDGYKKKIGGSYWKTQSSDRDCWTS